MANMEDAYFRGDRIGDMSREQLFEVIEYLSTELSQYQTSEIARAIALGKVERIKRGEA
jgi:hypothetical protein